MLLRGVRAAKETFASRMLAAAMLTEVVFNVIVSDDGILICKSDKSPITVALPSSQYVILSGRNILPLWAIRIAS